MHTPTHTYTHTHTHTPTHTHTYTQTPHAHTHTHTHTHKTQQLQPTTSQIMIPAKSPNYQLPSWSHKHISRAKDWWILNTTLKISKGLCSLVIRDVHCTQIGTFHATGCSFAGFRLKSLCIKQVSTGSCGGQIKSLWESNHGRQGLEFSRKSSVGRIRKRRKYLIKSSKPMSKTNEIKISCVYGVQYSWFSALLYIF